MLFCRVAWFSFLFPLFVKPASTENFASLLQFSGAISVQVRSTFFWSGWDKICHCPDFLNHYVSRPTTEAKSVQRCVK